MTRRRELHGQRHTRLYRIWKGMNQRCSDPNHERFSSYGGRGIAVCAEWYWFTDFQAWALANGYTDDLTLDRQDNDGPYSPENCRWATPKEQAANSSKPRLLTAWGETKNLSDWAADQRCVVRRETLGRRTREGWGVEKALTTPSRSPIRRKL